MTASDPLLTVVLSMKLSSTLLIGNSSHPARRSTHTGSCKLFIVFLPAQFLFSLKLSDLVGKVSHSAWLRINITPHSLICPQCGIPLV